MKILMLCEFYSESVEFQENLLVKYYGKHGHQVTVITSTFESVFDYYGDRHDNTRPATSYYDGGAKIIRLPYRYNLLNRLRAYTRIDAILEEEAPDLIFVHDIMPNLPETIAYVRAHPDCRMILDYHADYSNSGKNALSRWVLHGVLRKRILDRARPYLSRIFPVVPASATFLHEIYRIPYSEMEILPLGADMDLAKQVAQNSGRAALRASLGIDPGDLVVFTGGKVTPRRRTEVLFEAVARLPHLPLAVVVIGDSSPEDKPYRQMLEERARDCRSVRFVGWQDREGVYRHMSISDLAVFPAAQSIIWQQSIAMGLPLIVGDTGSQDISYLNLEENIVILRGDEIRPERLAQAIEEVVATPGRLERMGRGAAKVAAAELDWNSLIHRTLRFNSAARDSAPTEPRR